MCNVRCLGVCWVSSKRKLLSRKQSIASRAAAAAGGGEAVELITTLHIPKSKFFQLVSEIEPDF